MKVKQTPFFSKIKKKLHSNQISDLDNAIKKIIQNPEIGEQKKGDLNPVFVYKFKMNKQEALLAYTFQNDFLILLAIGASENFYRDLKRII